MCPSPWPTKTRQHVRFFCDMMPESKKPRATQGSMGIAQVQKSAAACGDCWEDLKFRPPCREGASEGPNGRKKRTCDVRLTRGWMPRLSDEKTSVWGRAAADDVPPFTADKKKSCWRGCSPPRLLEREMLSTSGFGSTYFAPVVFFASDKLVTGLSGIALPWNRRVHGAGAKTRAWGPVRHHSWLSPMTRRSGLVTLTLSFRPSLAAIDRSNNTNSVACRG